MPVTAKDKTYLTLPEASEKYGVSVSTLRSWRRKRLITRYERGDGLVVVDAADVERQLARRTEIRQVEDGDAGE